MAGGGIMNILEELYYGNINPQEKCFKYESEYAANVKILADNEKKLSAYFNNLPNVQKEQRLFSQLMEAQSEIIETETCESFIEGWKLGARFMLETFLMPRQSPFSKIH